MIRNSGILAAFATAFSIAMLVRSIHSAEVTVIIPRDEAWKVGFDGYSDPLPLEVRWLGSPVLDGGSLEDAGVHYSANLQDGIWVLFVPDKVAEATRKGDELKIHSKHLKVLKSWTMARYELRRGASVQLFNGPENIPFMLMVAVMLGGPLSLWGLAAGIVALTTLRRGPSTSLPDSPGIRGSP